MQHSPVQPPSVTGTPHVPPVGISDEALDFAIRMIDAAILRAYEMQNDRTVRMLVAVNGILRAEAKFDRPYEM